MSGYREIFGSLALIVAAPAVAQTAPRPAPSPVLGKDFLTQAEPASARPDLRRVTIVNMPVPDNGSPFERKDRMTILPVLSDDNRGLRFDLYAGKSKKYTTGTGVRSPLSAGARFSFEF